VLLEGCHSRRQELLVLQRAACKVVAVSARSTLRAVLFLHMLHMCCLMVLPVHLLYQVSLVQVLPQAWGG
jgi:hypothetical protein